MKLPRVVRWFLWLVALPALAVLGLRTFVGNVYYVDSHSMEPLLHGAAEGGDYVLVLFDSAPQVERFDVVVLRRPHERDPLVKRVGGLPGEQVQISGGDLFINGRRLPPDAPRPPWIPIYDSARHAFAEHFHFDRNRWRATPDGGYRIDGGDAKASFAKLRMRGLDDYVAPDHERVEGKVFVNDLALEIEFRRLAAGAQLLLKVTEESDVFRAELAMKNALDGTLTLSRVVRGIDGDAEPEKLAVTDVTLDDGEAWHTLRLANRDNELRVELDVPRAVITHLYTTNTPSLRQTEGGFAHILPRAECGGTSLDVEIRRVRVERDVMYLDLGPWGTTEPLTLGPEQLFLLGDNSRESNDSREWGPVPRTSLMGLPRAVVWPPERLGAQPFRAQPGP